MTQTEACGLGHHGIMATAVVQAATWRVPQRLIAKYYFEVHVYRTAEARVTVVLSSFFGSTRAQVGCRLPVCLYVFMCL